jgi:hypothetical protein
MHILLPRLNTPTAMEMESKILHFTKSGKMVEKLVKEHFPASHFENSPCERLVEIGELPVTLLGPDSKWRNLG